MILREPRKVALICLVFLLVWTLFFAILRVDATTTNGSFVLYPEDTEIMENLPNSQSWFTNPQIQLANWTGLEKRGYFKFDLFEGYRGALTVTLAQLHFHMDNLDIGYTGAEIDIYDTNNETWFDHNITWNNAPPIQYLEVYDSVVSSTPKWFNLWLSDSGNSSFSVGGLQEAYDTNSTRTFVMAFPLYYSFMEWGTNESASYRPYLTVFYSQTITTEDEQTRPNIIHPTYHNVKFFAIADSVVESYNVTENLGTQNESQVEALIGSGYVTIMYLKFNLSFPDRIDNALNTQNFSLTNVDWFATMLNFKIFASFVPSTYDFRGFFITEGILRADETSWTETGITWTNKPSSRGYTCFQKPIDVTGYTAFDLRTEEDYIRYSIANDTSYTIILEVDQRASRSVFANFYTREADFSVPYVEMNIITEPSALALSLPLSWTTADEYLANTWNLTPFIAGHLLSAMILSVTIVPIGWIARSAHEKKKEILTLLLFTLIIELSAFLIFTWLHIGIYVILLILLILFAGGVLKA